MLPDDPAFWLGFWLTMGYSFACGVIAVLKWICNAIGARYG